MYVSALFFSFTYNDIQNVGSDHLFVSSEPLDVRTYVGISVTAYLQYVQYFYIHTMYIVHSKDCRQIGWHFNHACLEIPTLVECCLLSTLSSVHAVLTNITMYILTYICTYMCMYINTNSAYLCIHSSNLWAD